MSDDNVYLITDAPEQEKVTEDTTSEAPTDNAEGPAIRFGFVVLVDTNGTMYVERNKTAIAGVTVERDATLIEVRRYANEIIFDLAAQASAEYTTMRLEAAKQQAQSQEQCIY